MRIERKFQDAYVSTHSRPKAAGFNFGMNFRRLMFQHTAARRRLDLFGNVLNKPNRFQHTAARRRLTLIFSSIKTIV